MSKLPPNTLPERVSVTLDRETVQTSMNMLGQLRYSEAQPLITDWEAALAKYLTPVIPPDGPTVAKLRRRNGMKDSRVG